MAEALLLDLATSSVKAVGKLIMARGLDEIKLTWGQKDEFEKLKTKFSELQPFLQDVANAKHADKRIQVINWLEKLKDAAYFADDIIDDYAYEILRREIEQEEKLKKQSRDFFSRHNPVVFRVKMSHKVRDAMAMFDELEKKARDIGLSQLDITRDGMVGTWADNNEGSMSLSQARQYAAADATEFVGRVADEEKLLQLLCHPSNNERHISTIAIVGLGGLGKTTFARRLHENEKVCTHFEKRLWICVSENFDIKKILNEMLEYVTSKKGDLANIGAIIKKLQEKLTRKKYLLVLDDVWCTDQELWSNLKNALLTIGGLQGSVILITTRINDVATRSGAVYKHPLKGLSEEESWKLLKQKAFIDETSSNISSLEKIGRRIIQKCCGVPLAIKAIGAILQLKQHPHEWETIENSDVWGLPQNNQNQILPSLRLTFNHLPSLAMKQCFSHCAVISKGFTLAKDDLGGIWLAQGFLQESETRNMTMEEIGEEYFMVLQNYSLLQEIEKEDHDNHDVSSGYTSYIDEDGDGDGDDDDDDDDDDDGIENGNNEEVARYNMHDLVHDLAIDVSGKDILFWQLKDHQQIDNCRHLVLTGKDVKELSKIPITNTLRKLRTITGGLPLNVLTYAKCLRTLTLDACEIEEVPTSIGLLKHLRLLSLSYNPIKTIPDSIGKLYLLQTLRILGCYSMKVLPSVLYRLVKLRHIPTTTYMHASRGLAQLVTLQTLPHLVLVDGDSNVDGWSIDELGNLLKLRGEIHISGLEHVKTKENAMKADLAGKAKVSKLILSWAKKREESSSGSYDEAVLDGLQPHPNLMSLELKNFQGLVFPSWMKSMAVVTKNGSSPTPLENITSLKLQNCHQCQVLPKLGQLPCLKYLTLSKVNVESIGTDFYGVPHHRSSNINLVSFPSLIKLEISKCRVLKTWVLPPSTDAINVFPRLEVLRVTDCPGLETLPALHFQSIKKVKLDNIGIQSFSMASPSVKLMLETLEITQCDELVSLPRELQYVTSLKTMIIARCPALTSLPDDLFHGLTSLSELSIDFCEALNNIPISLEGCSSLARLLIQECSSIKGQTPDFSKLKGVQELCKSGNPIKLMISMLKAVEHLPSLRSLETGLFTDEEEQELYFSDVSPIIKNHSLNEIIFVGGPDIKSLPGKLQLLTEIKYLRIEEVDELEELPDWVGRLSSLEDLQLEMCRKLKYLPSQEVFLQMTQLRRLWILDCPILAKSCVKDAGLEWSKISHIPFIKIDDDVIQNLV